MPDFIVDLSRHRIAVTAPDPETAVLAAFWRLDRDPDDVFRGVYVADDTPRCDARRGAPMGRMSQPLAPDGVWSARAVTIDADGYDPGTAYWGIRPRGQQLFAVQDGCGHVAYVDAASRESAIAIARADG